MSEIAKKEGDSRSFLNYKVEVYCTIDGRKQLYIKDNHSTNPGILINPLIMQAIIDWAKSSK